MAVPQDAGSNQEPAGLDRWSKATMMRQEYGHWEADMIVTGDHQHGLNVLVEQMDCLTHISLLENKTATMTKQAMLWRLRHYPTTFTQSIHHL